MMNHVTLVGRLVKDPEIRKVGENNVSSFTVAVDNWQKGADGNRTTSFFSCTLWGARAEGFQKYARKGLLIGVEGQIIQRNYEGKDGSKRTAYEIHCDNATFLEPKQAEPKPEEGRKEPVVDESVGVVPSKKNKLSDAEQKQLNELLAKSK